MSLTRSSVKPGDQCIDPNALERDLVIQLLVEGATAAAALAAAASAERAGSPEIAATALLALVALFAVEHGEGGVEPLQHDLGRVALGSRLIGPFAGLQGA